ncbi:hypothetical protein ACFCWY_08655 [Streptomyces sp. NPDC056362]|uniref:hypothetical protein n=1 Tax=unclassified Streptomyces TaxID=2593676 RepID=UPI0035D59E23
MSVQPTLADVVDQFAKELSHGTTITSLAPALSCRELTALTDLLRTGGHSPLADAWIEEHQAREKPTDCDGHPAARADAGAPPFDEHGRYTPAPGTEYPFSVSDIARATVQLLGPEWHAESGAFGATGVITGSFTGRFVVLVDGDSDLCIESTRYEADGWPESPELPDGVEDYEDGVFLPGAFSASGLDALAEGCAAAIRAVTGR